jgi:hypothetical protein
MANLASYAPPDARAGLRDIFAKCPRANIGLFAKRRFPQKYVVCGLRVAYHPLYGPAPYPLGRQKRQTSNRTLVAPKLGPRPTASFNLIVVEA